MNLKFFCPKWLSISALILILAGCRSPFPPPPVNLTETTSPVSELTPITSWQTIKLVHNLSLDNSPTRAIAVSPDSELLAAGSFDGYLKLWYLPTGKLRHTIEFNTSVQSIAFSPDGETLATGDGEGRLKLWNISTGKLIKTFVGHRFPVDAVAFSPD